MRLATKAQIIQGSLAGSNSGEGASVNAPIDQVVALTVRVDLDKQKVTFTAGTVTVEADLKTPMKSITHVGYCTASGLAEFSPVEIK